MTGPFAQVGLVMTGGIVSRIDFTLRGDAFKVGDAVLLWGRPTLHRQEHVVDLFWTNRGVNASTYSTSGRLSYLLPLWNLSFSVDRAG
jgi:hypothetical protein